MHASCRCDVNSRVGFFVRIPRHSVSIRFSASRFESAGNRPSRAQAASAPVNGPALFALNNVCQELLTRAAVATSSSMRVFFWSRHSLCPALSSRYGSRYFRVISRHLALKKCADTELPFRRLANPSPKSVHDSRPGFNGLQSRPPVPRERERRHGFTN